MRIKPNRLGVEVSSLRADHKVASSNHQCILSKGKLCTNQHVWPRISIANKIIRFFSHAIHTRILNPALVPVILRALRAALFPNNSLGPPRQVPTEEEAKAIKSRCAISLLALLPVPVASAFFATPQRERQLEHIEEILSSFEDAYLNKHLIYQVVELIILRLAPELGSKGVEELYKEHMI